MGKMFVEITILVPRVWKLVSCDPRDIQIWKLFNYGPWDILIWQIWSLSHLWEKFIFRPSVLVNYKSGPCGFVK